MRATERPNPKWLQKVHKEVKEMNKVRNQKNCKHDFVNEDYAGPDSGGMAGTCKKCGFSYNTVLY
jgi:hypothetical protein